MSEQRVHATCVALGRAREGGGAAGGGARQVGVLLRGPSGAGKSDLALRLIDGGARLIADDQTLLVSRDGALIARAPETIAGRMEVRGVGIAVLPQLQETPLGLVVDLVPPAEVERLPAPAFCEILGVRLPLLKLDPFETSAPAKLRLAATAPFTPTDTALPADPQGPAPANPPAPAPQQAAAPQAAAPQAAAPQAAAPQAAAPQARTLVLVTGMSGAGRSTALSILEDLGFESIDNPPLHLLDYLLGEGESRPMAVGVDIRTRGLAVRSLLETLDRWAKDPALSLTLLYLDCDDEVLRRRYTETRRRHPLAHGRPLSDGIAAERKLIAVLRARADLVVDTSMRTAAELRQVLGHHFDTSAAERMTIFVTSFAYANGLPRDADLVFDVRFLRNPHYDLALRPLSGRDPRVAEHVAADPDFEAFFGRLTGLLAPLLPRFRQEGKSYLTIAIGCTGGRHRSVAVAERLVRWLEARGEPVTLDHRDLEDAAPPDSNEA